MCAKDWPPNARSMVTSKARVSFFIPDSLLVTVADKFSRRPLPGHFAEVSSNQDALIGSLQMLMLSPGIAEDNAKELSPDGFLLDLGPHLLLKISQFLSIPIWINVESYFHASRLPC
jgi:undecaprenyl pyrophosphate phosphatase UppP